MKDLTIDEIKQAIDKLTIPLKPYDGSDGLRSNDYDAGWNAALGTIRDDIRALARSKK